MARFPLFFVSAFLVIAAMIGVALLPLQPKRFGTVEARNDQGTFILDGASLLQIKPARGFPVTPAPGPRGDQSGPRLASVSALAPGAKYSKGARLMLGPKTTASLTGKAFSVVITARSVANTPARKIGFGLVAGGPIQWRMADISPDFGAVRFDVAASNSPLKGLAIWPAIEGQGHGIEITSIALQPFVTPQATP